jgi:L-amino acid N-acyltransferase YncA
MTTQRDTAVTLRDATPADAAALAEIYNHYVAHTTITFEEAPVSADDMAMRVDEVRRARLPYLVAEASNAVIGFAYASKWKGRCAYRFSAETTVYLSDGHVRRGLGLPLYQRLLADLAQAGMHAAIGGIALPNEASIALHEKCGFSQVARFREVGFKFGRWIDVGYWQLVFESPATTDTR